MAVLVRRALRRTEERAEVILRVVCWRTSFFVAHTYEGLRLSFYVRSVQAIRHNELQAAQKARRQHEQEQRRRIMLENGNASTYF